jgi:plasmid stabilization system protein ParE
MNVRYHALARQEVIEATQYYAKVQPELGEAFETEFAAAVERIAANPFQFEQVRQEIRRCILNRFPYSIYFRLPDVETVRILVVKHHRRRPGLGMRRF